MTPTSRKGKKHLKVQVWIWAELPGPGPRRGRGGTPPAEPGRLQVLLLKTRPERGQFWQPVTGSVERDEPVEEAALREAREESGLRFEGGPEPLGRPFSFRKRGKNFVEYAFALQARLPAGKKKLPKVRLDPHEHTDYEWLDAGQAGRRLAYASNKRKLDTLRRQRRPLRRSRPRRQKQKGK